MDETSEEVRRAQGAEGTTEGGHEGVQQVAAGISQLPAGMIYIQTVIYFGKCRQAILLLDCCMV